MAKPRKIYWLAQEVQASHQGKALLLKSQGFDVHFFNTLKKFREQYIKSRSGIIFISDNGPEMDILDHVDQITKMPETQGARMVLILENHFNSLMDTAASLCFREMIPLAVDDGEWIQRILLSCASKPVPYVPPNPQLTVNQVSSIDLPARITWIGDERLRLECKFRPPIGSNLKITGLLAETLGIKSVHVTVEENHRNKLHYRFSDAVVASWKIPPEVKERFQDMIWKLRKQFQSPLYRAFVVIKELDLRLNVIANLNREDFTVKSALQIQSIEEEPKYFTPDIIFIEDQLTANAHESRFAKMLETIPNHVPVVVIGVNYGVSELKGKYPNKNLMILKRMPTDFSKTVLDRLIPSIARDTSEHDFGAALLPLNHSLSSIFISVSARLTQIHPKACRMTIPYKLNNYALAKINSPLLKKQLTKAIWLKVTDTEESSRSHFSYTFDAYFVNHLKSDQETIATLLQDILSSNYKRLLEDQHHPVPEKAVAKETKEPEKNIVQHTESQQEKIPTLSLPTAKDDLLAGIQPDHSLGFKEDAIEQDFPESNIEEIEIFGKEDLQSITTPSRSYAKRSSKKQKHSKIASILILTILFGFLIAVLVSIFYILERKAPGESGKKFTESLYKFAPHTRKPPVPFQRGNKEEK